MAIPVITGLARAAYEERVPKRWWKIKEALADTIEAIGDTAADHAVLITRAKRTGSAADLERAAKMEQRHIALTHKHAELEAKLAALKPYISRWRQNPLARSELQNLANEINEHYKGFESISGAPVKATIWSTGDVLNLQIGKRDIDIDVNGKIVGAGHTVSRNPKQKWQSLLWSVIALIGLVYVNFRRA